MRRLSLVVFLSALALSSSAQARGKHPPSVLHEDHVMAGMKGVTITEQMRADGHTHHLNGVGVAGFGEATLLHDRLALELDVVMTMPGDEMTWSTEPLIKAPWHVNAWFEPFAAVGPMFMHVRDAEGDRHWLNGGQIVLGTYFWFAETLGIDLDVAVGAARGSDMSVVEFVFAAGPVLRD